MNDSNTGSKGPDPRSKGPDPVSKGLEIKVADKKKYVYGPPCGSYENMTTDGQHYGTQTNLEDQTIGTIYVDIGTGSGMYED